MMNVVHGTATAGRIHMAARLNQDVYLRGTTEFYHKMLVVRGFERVYEIGKQFSNEGIQ